MVEDAKTFDKVYNKLVAAIEYKLKTTAKLREVGGVVNFNTVKLLNLYITYLDYVKNSKYKYFCIPNLTNISNYLNKI